MFLKDIQKTLDKISYNMIKKYLKFCLKIPKSFQIVDITNFFQIITQALEDDIKNYGIWNFDLALLCFILYDIREKLDFWINVLPYPLLKKLQESDKFTKNYYSNMKNLYDANEPFFFETNIPQNSPDVTNDYFYLERTNDIVDNYRYVELDIGEDYYLKCNECVFYKFSFKKFKEENIVKPLMVENSFLCGVDPIEFLYKKLTERQKLYRILDKKKRKYISVKFNCENCEKVDDYKPRENTIFVPKNIVKMGSKYSYIKMEFFQRGGLLLKNKSSLKVPDKNEDINHTISDSENGSRFDQTYYINQLEDLSFYLNKNPSDKNIIQEMGFYPIYNSLNLSRKCETEYRNLSILKENEVEFIEDEILKCVSALREKEDKEGMAEDMDPKNIFELYKFKKKGNLEENYFSEEEEGTFFGFNEGDLGENCFFYPEEYRFVPKISASIENEDWCANDKIPKKIAVSLESELSMENKNEDCHHLLASNLKNLDPDEEILAPDKEINIK